MKNFIYALLTGIILAISWPTYGFPLFIFFAFIPLLLAEFQIRNNAKSRIKLKVFGVAYLSFFVWNLITTYWVSYSTLFGGIFAILANSLLMSIVFLLYHIVAKRTGFSAASAFLISIWMVFEKIHLNWDFSWPWLNLGNVFSEYISWVQWYEFTGTFGGTLWVWLVNIAIFKAILQFKAIKKNHINEVVVASAYQKGLMLNLYNQLSELLKKGFPIRDYTQVYEEVTRRIPVQNVDKDFYRFFPFSRSNQNKFYILIFRVFDIIFSSVGIIFGIIISPIIILGNLWGNHGKLFYRQERVGKNGEVFDIFKLRTMTKDAEILGPQYAQKNDYRITRFGKFLRRSRIDEIPQFFNVLMGDMSLIGPRPERPIFVKELSELIPFYETRHIIKPGLTGWAQVMANYGDCYDDSLEKLQYDLYYIKHRGIFLDLSILLKTLSTVIFFRGQ